MTEEEKMLWMFIQAHGQLTGACYAEVEFNEERGDAVAVHCMKDGHSCWSYTKAELVFEYLTRHLQDDC